MPCKLMLARRSFFALRHRRGRKNNVQNQVRRIRLPAGVPAADLCGQSVLPICILRTHGRTHAYLRRRITGDFGRICWIMSGNREIGRMHIGLTMDLVISFKITEQKLKSYLVLCAKKSIIFYAKGYHIKKGWEQCHMTFC